MSEEVKILQEINKIIKTLSDFEIIESSFDLQERIDVSKAIDGIKDVQEAYAGRHKMCAKHAEPLYNKTVHYSKDNTEYEAVCRACELELC